MPCIPVNVGVDVDTPVPAMDGPPAWLMALESPRLGVLETEPPLAPPPSSVELRSVMPPQASKTSQLVAQ